MQGLNWNDLRYVLAIGRGRRLVEAARMLGVDDTTVSRRLAALRKATGKRIFQRLPDGRLELTEAGRELAVLAERMERDIDRLANHGPDGEGQVLGMVRLTSVPLVVNRILAPAVDSLFGRHPRLQLELVADARDFSLTRREADMALRMARPKTGGTRVKARRIGTLPFGPYASAAYSGDDLPALPWVMYDERMSSLPQARWMAMAAKSGQTAPTRLNVGDIETALEAVAAGHGRSVLPRLVADGDARLRRLPEHRGATPLGRELWLLVHSELAELPGTKAVADWIDSTINVTHEV